MHRFRPNPLPVLIALSALLLTSAAHAVDGYVSMTGEWYFWNGPSVNIPYNPPVVNCDPAVDAACPNKISLTGTQNNKPSFGIPASGTIKGGLDAGAPFEIEPRMFAQDVGSQFGNVPFNFFVQQINTRFSFQGPATSRQASPPPNTRQFASNAWMLPGNGQTGRLSANSSHVSPDGNTTVTYQAGSNAFGGTMHVLLRGPGEIFLNGAILGSASFPTSLRPLVGIQPIGTTTPSGEGVFRTRPAGIGWDVTATGMQAAGVAKGGAVIATPCVQQVPALPEGCDLVLDTGFTTLFTLPPAISVIHGFPWTTGMVRVAFKGTVGGQPGTFTISATGFDRTTPSGVRNISMVAGSYQVRTDAFGVQYTPTLSAMELTFVPEPVLAVPLAGGAILLGLLQLRERRRSHHSRSGSHR